MKLETNGHYHGIRMDEQFMRGFHMDLWWFRPAPVIPGEWGRVTDAAPRSYACPHCGQCPPIETNGTDYRFGGEPCPRPNGLVTVFDLACPSGVLVVANDLRHLAPVPTDTFNVNINLGCDQTSRAYANAGMAHAFVGNTCPGVFKSRGHTYRIGYERRRGQRLAGICTDLWWYSLMDADVYANRVAFFGGKSEPEQVIRVKPGVYRFTHTYDRESDTFSKFEWVGPCEAQPDTWLEQFKSAMAGAGACVAQLMHDWPTLYGNSPVRALDSIFESRRDWHPNGHPLLALDPNIVPVEIGRIEGQHHWSLSSCGILANAAGIYPSWAPPPNTDPKLNPSFLRAAYFALKNIEEFGVACYREDLARETVNIAKRIYAGLTERYPEFGHGS